MAGTAVATKQEHRTRGVVRTSVALTTHTDGSVSATVVGVGFGRLVGFLEDGGLDSSGTITLSDTKTGATLFTWTTAGAASFVRPTANIVTVAGAAVTAADTAPNVDRDIYVSGKLTITVASGGSEASGTIALIVDETGVGDLALTV
jgi:hypothetical protein